MAFHAIKAGEGDIFVSAGVETVSRYARGSSDGLPSAQTGVAMITGADEAIAAHQRVAEAMWRDAVKGPAGAARLREIMRDMMTN